MPTEKLDLKHFEYCLAKRPAEFHKGDAGYVLVIGGDYGTSGAVRMAAEAALRVGAGLVRIVTRKEHAFVLNIACPEIMCHGLKDVKEIIKLAEKSAVIVIGPGLGQSGWSRKILKTTLKIKKPMVVDADALTLLAETPYANRDWVLTPHAGEAATLLLQTSEEIQKDRKTAVKKIQSIYGGVCVLKGSGTLIFSEESGLSICEAGNPGMATAGMGDVLSGVIAGLIAQKIPLATAARLGVLLHATAGDMSAEAHGQRGMLATDLLPYLRKLVNPTC